MMRWIRPVRHGCQHWACDLGIWRVQLWRSADESPAALNIGRTSFGRDSLVCAHVGRWYFLAAIRTEPRFTLAG